MGVLVRPGSVRQHAFRPSYKWSQLRGLAFGFLSNNLLFHRLHFILSIRRILEIVIKRAQDFAIQRAPIILCTLCNGFMKRFFIRDANGYLDHAVIVAALRRLVKPQNMAVSYG